MDTPRSYASFASKVRIASGDLVSVLTKTKARIDEGEEGPILIFENETGRQVDFDFSGTVGEVIERVAPARAQVGPGRPKLGVVSREVSLLPAHWEWLEAQPQGISGALRRLVQEVIEEAIQEGWRGDEEDSPPLVALPRWNGESRRERSRLRPRRPRRGESQHRGRRASLRCARSHGPGDRRGALPFRLRRRGPR